MTCSIKQLVQFVKKERKKGRKKERKKERKKYLLDRALCSFMCFAKMALPAS